MRRGPEGTPLIFQTLYKNVFTTFHETEKLTSTNLYQMFSYLKNSECLEGEPVAEGLLIYPSSEEDVTLSYELSRRKLRVATVDLNAQWQQIEARLLELVAIKTESPVQV
jgi:5-methylcytosine-specific restriction enzyme subunit McrC